VLERSCMNECVNSRITSSLVPVKVFKYMSNSKQIINVTKVVICLLCFIFFQLRKQIAHLEPLLDHPNMITVIQPF